MTDEPEKVASQSALARLPMSNDKVSLLLQAIFPRSTIDILHNLSGIPKRSISRWIEGTVRVPPTIVEKLTDQRKLQRQFGDEIEEIMKKYDDAGVLRIVIRSELLTRANVDWLLDNGDDEI